MFRLITASLLSFGLLSSVFAEEGSNTKPPSNSTDALSPLVTLRVYREAGHFVASHYEIASWANELTEPHWESISERQERLSNLLRSKGFEHYLKKFLDSDAYWQLAKLGIWIRFPEGGHLTYYFLPFHRPAREVLAHFDTLENAGARVDFIWDPRRIQSDGAAGVSSLVLRIYFSQLKNFVRSDQESLIQVLDRIGANIEATYSAEVLEGDEGLSPEQVQSHCVRLAREIGFRSKDS